MILRLRCEGILARVLIDWPRLLVGKSSDFIESVSQFKAILRHSQIWSCVGLAVPIVPSLAYGYGV